MIKCLTIILIEMECGNVAFRGEEKTREALGTRTRTNNKLNLLMTPSPGIEPGPHWQVERCFILFLSSLQCKQFCLKINNNGGTTQNRDTMFQHL